MAKIHPSAIIEDGAVLGENVDIGPFCHVGSHVTLADGVKLGSHVVIEGGTSLGPRTVVHAHAVLGGGPQYRGDPGIGTKLLIGADNVIREHVTMNVGSTKGAGITRVGDRGYFMAYSHVGHDCQIGNGVTFANVGSAGGHVHIGDGANISTLAGVQQFGRVGRYAFVGALTGATSDVIPYGMVVGHRAHLRGLNIIGLKRMGMKREQIHLLRAAYRFIFLGDGVLAARAEQALARWPGVTEIREIVEFILADAKRPICMPGARDDDPE